MLELPVLSYLHLPLLAAVLARTTGFFVVVPFFSTEAAPLPLRGGLAFAVALLLYPLHSPESLPESAVAVALVILLEVAVGLFLGWLVRVLFAGLQLAGQLAGFGIGLSLAQVIDPSSTTQDSVGPALYQYLGLVLFVVAGGHRELLGALLDSYRVLPIGGATFTGGLLDSTLVLVGAMFETGLRLAAPVAALLFLVDLVLTLANRVVPQIPILMVGMPVKTWLGLAALGWGLAAFAGPAMVWVGRADELILAASQLMGAGR